MTPEAIGALLASFVFGLLSYFGVTKLQTGRKSYKDLFTEATVASLEQAEELREAKEQLKDYAVLFEQHKQDMLAVNGKLELLDQQRAEQEQRHTRQMVEQEQRHSSELAKVVSKRDGLQDELQRINKRVEEQALNLKQLEADNTKLRQQQQDCERLSAERDAIAADLKRAEKRIAELEKLVELLTKPTPPTPPGAEAEPPKKVTPTKADGAEHNAIVDLPVTRDLGRTGTEG